MQAAGLQLAAGSGSGGPRTGSSWDPRMLTDDLADLVLVGIVRGVNILPPEVVVAVYLKARFEHGVGFQAPFSTIQHPTRMGSE